ncbi:MAG: DUF1003 domain-containing protein [Bacteroidetes bacterium]|nr:DUF1003 domain-containing protein [Bacteroidota bacterium]
MKCPVCGKEYPEEKMISGYGIRHEIETLIIADHPDWDDSHFICENDFSLYRRNYILGLVTEEQGQIEKLNQEVIDSIHQSDLLSKNINVSFTEERSIGAKISDKVAQFGGSWKFIITFFVILIAWITLNSVALLSKNFDPFPFILLNLILSCIAAIQAPIIMMSQNRQESKDRIRSENDYKVNLKAEIEIRTLHEKIDHLLLDQWSRMMQIQQVQLDMLDELRKALQEEKK